MLNSKHLQPLQFNTSKHHFQIKLIQPTPALSSLYCHITSCISSRKKPTKQEYKKTDLFINSNIW